ncbi:MAG: peptidoglycan DD-metalloendopeptidase family protein [Ignavibacteria bacterium]|nr:peptidoglycan DD-metalloendopeptidase family protein [Ignavibacteria bacterium]
MIRTIKYLIIFITITAATYEEILTDKRKQVEIYEKIISENRLEYKETESEIARLKSRLDSLESAYSSIMEFLKNYENETYMTPEQIAVETNMIIYLAEEVERIQESFRKKVVSLYKYGKNYELELLLSSKTPNEYIRRNQYLQKFSQNRKKELRELKAKKFILEEKKKMLSLSTSTKRFYVENRRKEKSQLEGIISDIKQKLSELSDKSEKIILKISLYESNLNSVINFISNFQNNKDSFKGSKTIRLNYSGDFSNLKGKLNFPVDAGIAREPYGSQFSSGVEINNSSIGISVAFGSRVYAVASGIVTLTGEVPYYGKTVIISHGNGYRTVYSCLSEISVKPGEEIKLNQVIGKSGMTSEAQILYFGIWKDTTPLNPEEWIRSD